MRVVYATQSVIDHVSQKHSVEFDVERGAALLAHTLSDPMEIYIGQKKNTLVFVGDYNENYYLIVPIKTLPGENWLETYYIEGKNRLCKRPWVKRGPIYTRNGFEPLPGQAYRDQSLSGNGA